MAELRASSPLRPKARQHAGKLARQWAPWALAAIILGYVLTVTPRQELGQALVAVSLWQLGAIVTGLVIGALLADSLALWLALRAAAPERALRYRELLLVRGACSLLALISYGAGQGGIVYLLHQRHRVSLDQGAGAVLLASAAFLVALALALGAGLLAGAVPDRVELRAVALVALAILPVYLLIIRLRPAILVQRRVLRHLFAVSAGAVTRIAGARVLHLLVLIAGNWLVMQLFGVDVPVAMALVQLPVMFLVAALPISPAGLGTTQAAALTLFASFASGATEEARHAAVLAYSLCCQATSILLLAAIGLVCLRLLQRSQPASNQGSPGAAP